MKVYNEPLLRKATGALKQRPRSLSELSEQFNRHERTIKRWLVELRSRGFRVVRDGIETESPYYIAEERNRPWN